MTVSIEPPPGSWAGPIPSHWRTVRNLALFSERDERANQEQELLAVTTRYGVIRQDELRELTERKDTSAEDKSSYKLVRVGDVVYNKMRMWQGAVGHSQYDGIVSPAYVVLSPKPPALGRYFHYQFKTSEFVAEAGRHSYGLCDDMNSLRYSDFKTIYSVVPPLDEQCTIAEFLDNETRAIEEAIACEERLLAILEEAWVNRLGGFFHSLPDACLPPHWKRVRLKHAISPGSSISYGIVQPGDPVQGGAPFLQTTNITGESLPLQELPTTSAEIERQYPRSRLRSGDVILGIRASIGAAHTVPPELEGVNLSRGVARIVPGPALLNDFLVWFLRSHLAQSFWQEWKQGSTFNEVSIATVKELPIPLPPLAEQNNIVTGIEDQYGKHKALNRNIRSTIQKLEEYKLSVITAAVNGRLDVRNYRPQEAVASCR